MKAVPLCLSIYSQIYGPGGQDVYEDGDGPILVYREFTVSDYLVKYLSCSFRLLHLIGQLRKDLYPSVPMYAYANFLQLGINLLDFSTGWPVSSKISFLIPIIHPFLTLGGCLKSIITCWRIVLTYSIYQIMRYSSFFSLWNQRHLRSLPMVFPHTKKWAYNPEEGLDVFRYCRVYGRGNCRRPL